MKKISWLLCLGIATQFAACTSHKEKEENTEENKFLVTTPICKDTTINKEYVCQIRAIQHIELKALERGYLQKIYVDEGQFVRKGQPMFQIMPMLYEAELQKAAAETNYCGSERGCGGRRHRTPRQ